MNALLALRLFLSFAPGYFLSYLLRNANAVIAQALSAELGLSAATLGLMTSAYLLAFGAFQLSSGVLPWSSPGRSDALADRRGGLLALLAVQLDRKPARVWWCALGLAFPLGNLAYALLGHHVPAQRAGRVATALNLAIFLGAAFWQWGLGLLVDALQAQGMTQVAALRGTFACLWLAQLLGCAWFMLRWRRYAAPSVRASRRHRQEEPRPPTPR